MHLTNPMTKQGPEFKPENMNFCWNQYIQWLETNLNFKVKQRLIKP